MINIFKNFLNFRDIFLMISFKTLEIEWSETPFFRAFYWLKKNVS